MATFITSKTVGEIINIYVKTSTGYWKYNHNGSDSSLLENTENKTTTNISITNVNGEFTIIPCDLEGNVTGNITQLYLQNNQLTSFDGTGLSSLITLNLSVNQLTSLDGFILPTSLTHLDLGLNQLTSFDGTGLYSLTTLDLQGNQLTSFDGTGLSDLINLDLSYSPLTSFIGGDMGLITSLNFPIWNITTLTSFDGTGLSSLTILELGNNQLTSFDGTGLSSLTYLDLNINQLTSFDGTGLSSLTELYLINNLLTSFDGTGLSSLTYIEMNGNPFTPSTNNQILDQFNQIGLSGGYIMSSNGRTSASNADYDNLVNNLGWTFDGFDLVITPQQPTFITSKAVGETINIYAVTSTGFWKYNHDGSDSSVFDQSDGSQSPTISNTNGEFTIISCGSDGTVSGDILALELIDNQLTSFDGTGLTSLTFLSLSGNLLTSFYGTGLSSLTQLNLYNNQLTSLDLTGLFSLTQLYLGGNQLTPSANNQILNQLSLNGLSGSGFYSTGGRTSASNTDYNNLVSLGWNFEGLDLIIVGNGKLRVKGVNSGGGVILPQLITFTKADYGTDVDVVSQYLTLKRGNNQGLFNTNEGATYDNTWFGGKNHLWCVANEGDFTYDSYVDLWNTFDPSTIDITQLQSDYENGGNLFDFSDKSMVPWGRVHNSMPLEMLNKEMIMLDVLDGKFYKVKFTQWTSGNAGGGLSYTRQLISVGTTTTTTTTATPYYIYDFTSKVQYGDSLGEVFEKAGVTDWDGIERFVATDLNVGSQTYYIGTDGDKHPIPNSIAISNDGLLTQAESFINYLQISQGLIYGIYGDGVTFDSITPFV